MKNNSQLNQPGGIIVGVLVIVLGCLLLLDNLGWIELRYAMHFWPAILVIAGILKVVQSNNTSGHVVGAALIVVGLLLLLKRLGLFYLNWGTLWPVLIIFIGLSVVFKSLRTQHARLGAAARLDKEAADDAVIGVTAILGGYTRRITTPALRGGEVTAIMGGCELDLRQSSLQGEAVLTVFALCGGISIKVPPDWTVVLQGTPILGGFDEKTVAPPDGTKRLIVRGCAIMGGIEVRN
ncbi:LiaI-LiaF-like domain-containing protein [Janthinobacterium fluminis]|uniref:DUF5668 domain-containing protein n=1 Tax=Janthinobacterium fluminis TaxID=2987524 RepID=A0ABT5K053_9BURK|nr:DUF5668 domain-containing protein [Janthinobacterium fluminis]MDC8758343.1 DUF5668 domain-containing protein [Janthinobacterium fluminis]